MTLALQIVRDSILIENTMSTGKAAKLLGVGVTVKTLQRWGREGRLIPLARTDSNRRLYSDLNAALNLKRLATATAHPWRVRPAMAALRQEGFLS